MRRIYVALDFPDWKTTEQFLQVHDLHGIPVKIGMELFYREGINVVEQLKERGHPIFLDLKLHDIPTTVMRAMRNLASLEVDLVNVHALGGSEMIKRAKEGLQSNSQSRKETKLLAVTILTSMDEQTIHNDLTLRGTVEENVIHFANVAYRSGADGVVCSVHEVEQIKQHTSSQFITVTPGIRLAVDGADDQKRVATPSLAGEIGSTHIVIGRSITAASDPKQAYYTAMEEWNNGVSRANNE